MRHTGYMHIHMRMDWFFLDGRDDHSFANIAWVFGQHDLERKCDIKAYVA